MTRQEMYQFIAGLKEKYPTPTRDDGSGAGYCVGGALCGQLGLEDNFPDIKVLAAAITKQNPYCLRPTLHAIQVISANDLRDFSSAWRCLEYALLERVSP